MKYTVHVRSVVRIEVEVEADSPDRAVELACKQDSLDQTFRAFDLILNDERFPVEFMGEVVNEFLVDREDDEDHVLSTWHWYDKGRVVPMPEDEPSCMINQ